MLQTLNAPFAWLRRRWLSSPLAFTALLLAIFPLFLPLFFCCYVLEARLQLGHWPRNGDPDPKMLNLPHQPSLIALAMVQFPIYPIAAVILALIGHARRRDFPLWTVVILSSLSAGLVLILARWDPGGFIAWFLD